MKIKLLFVNDSLTLAGGERSLIALLSKIDPDKYDVDLQLFRYGEPLDRFIPKYVNILSPLLYTEFSKLSWIKSLLTFNFKFLNARLSYSLKLRKGHYRNSEIAQFFWETVGKVIDKDKKMYDVAIAYSQNTPTFFVMDKIQAKKKVAWVNVSVNYQEANKIFQEVYYRKYDKIVPVSKDTEQHFKNVYPGLANKLYTIEDMIDYTSILKMADFKRPAFDKNLFNILTVARLDKSQKGYDITLEACKILKGRNVKFHWYALGDGSYKDEMVEYIEKNELEDYFTFLGTTDNPYPYYRAADLYVQTSRHEGFGLSIAEARLLNTPVVTTRFDAVYMQMIDGSNGLVVDINAQAVADAVELMMKDSELYNSIVNYLKLEEKENYKSLNKFNQLIQGLNP